MSQTKQQALAVLSAIRANYINFFLVTPLLHATCYRLLTDCPDIDYSGVVELNDIHAWLINAPKSEKTLTSIANCRQEIIKEFHLEALV